jgi:DNA polymerase III delta prime subunit
MELAADILDAVGGAAQYQQEAGVQRATKTDLDPYLAIISEQRGLNRSQHEAIRAAALGEQSFELIHGPPGTGKTKTILALLNVLHISKYQEYYDAYLRALAPPSATAASRAPSSTPGQLSSPGTSADTPMLEQLLESVRSTTAAATAAVKLGALRSAQHAAAAQRKPRLLVTAQSNAAVDEIVLRIMREGFMDGERRIYYPDIVRIGAGARVSPEARAVTAEARADAFLRTLETAQQRSEWSQRWDNLCALLVDQLEKSHRPGDDLEARRQLMRLWDRFDRLQRDERRFRMATWPDGRISREQRIAWIAGTYLEEAEIVLCTLSGAALIKSWSREAISIASSSTADEPGRAGKAHAFTFPVVIVDEAAQATELATLIPLQYGCRRCILAGDPRQLPATVYSRGDAGAALAQSLMERLWRAGWFGHLLDTQYRMHPAIAAFPSRWFYQGQLQNDERVRDESYRPIFHRTGPPPPLLGPYCFMDIFEAAEERDTTTASIGNMSEAAFATELVRILCKRYLNESDRVWHVGILTPYRAQMRLLQQALAEAGLTPTAKPMSFTIEVDTVDAFQGREKDIVIFSAVRTNRQRRGIGFVGDMRRLNVALTRAKYSLVVLGHAAALRSGSADWDALLEDAERRGLYFQSTSEMVQQWLQRHAVAEETRSSRQTVQELTSPKLSAAVPASQQVGCVVEPATVTNSTSAPKIGLPSAADTASVVAFASALDPRLRQQPPIDAMPSNGVAADIARTTDAVADAEVTEIDARTFMVASLSAGFSLPSVVAAAYQAFPKEANLIALTAAELGALPGTVQLLPSDVIPSAPAATEMQTHPRAERKRKSTTDADVAIVSTASTLPPTRLPRHT